MNFSHLIVYISEDDSSDDDSESGLLIPTKGLQEGSEEMQKRVRKIEKIKYTFRDFLSVLDYYMLGLFVKFMLGFFTLCGVLCLVYVFVIFFFFENQWYEYFPVRDEF